MPDMPVLLEIKEKIEWVNQFRQLIQEIHKLLVIV